MSCTYPDCDCPVEYPQGYKPTEHECVMKLKKYWQVARYGSYGNVNYGTLAEAEEVAKRKAIQNPGVRFAVLEAVSTIQIDHIEDHAMEPL